MYWEHVIWPQCSGRKGEQSWVEVVGGAVYLVIPQHHDQCISLDYTANFETQDFLYLAVLALSIYKVQLSLFLFVCLQASYIRLSLV